MFGRHAYKMGVPAKSGGGFGCLWCRKKAQPVKCSYSVDNGSKRQNSNETDPLLAYAERQVRRLFGGKL